MPNRKLMKTKGSERPKKTLLAESGARDNKGNADVSRWIKTLRARLPDLRIHLRRYAHRGSVP